MFNVMCNVSKIEVDADSYIGRMFLRGLNSPDMSSTIRSFIDIDPEIHTIYTYSNGVMDVVYTRYAREKWEAGYPQGRVDRFKRGRDDALREQAPPV